jgi:hypothetical protein
MKFLVFMSDNRKLTNKQTDYYSLAAAINYQYCKKHNYDFIYYRPYLDNKDTVSLNNCIDPNTNMHRHPAWSKIVSTRLALELDYDYVVYTDSDCIFKDFNMSLEQFIGPHTDSEILFLLNKPWFYDKPCSGFFICKVGCYAMEFIKSWYSCNTPKTNMEHPWEQDALWSIYTNYKTAIIDSMMFEEEERQFIRHVSIDTKSRLSDTHDNRISYFQNIIREKNIDFEAVIQQIHYIEYDTRIMVTHE